MLSTPLICCSMGAATDCATVSASAPLYVAFICTSGGAICGNWALGSPRMAIPPARADRIAITIATMGRLMKNAVMSADLLLGRHIGQGVHRHSCAESHKAFDHDSFTGAYSSRHDPVFTYALAHVHRPKLDAVVGHDHDEHVLTLELIDCALW